MFARCGRSVPRPGSTLLPRTIRMVLTVAVAMFFILSTPLSSVLTKTDLTRPTSDYGFPKTDDFGVRQQGGPPTAPSELAPELTQAVGRDGRGCPSLEQTEACDTTLGRISPMSGLSNWSVVAGVTHPPDLMGAMMAFDAADNYTVLFGGSEWDVPPFHSYNETWTYRSGVWSELHPTPSPPPLSDGGFAMNPVTGCDVLFGGINVTSSTGNWVAENETWTFCHSAWQEDSASTNPGPSAGFAMISDAQCECVVAYNAGGGNNQFCCSNTLWTYTALGWTNITPASSPPKREYPAMAYDPAIEGAVMFGGFGYTSSDTYNDTWELTFNRDFPVWTEVFPRTVPPYRYAAGEAFDGTLGGVLMFGGLVDVDSVNSSFALNDTWLFMNGNWINETNSGQSPSPRGDFALTYDQRDQCAVLFGGGRSGGTTFGGTWTFDCPSVTFEEQGLPADAPWTVDLNGVPSNSSSGTHVFYLANRTFNFSVSVGPIPTSAEQFLPAFPGGNGSIGVTSALVAIPYYLHAQLTVVAQPIAGGEVGDSSGAAWPVVNSTIRLFARPNPGYVFVSWGGEGLGNYDGTDPNGSVTVLSPITEVAIFEAIYRVSFTARGLPTDTLWAIALGGVSRAASGSPIYFDEVNGSYCWRAYSNDSAFEASSSTGCVNVDGAEENVSISFHAIPVSSTGLSLAYLAVMGGSGAFLVGAAYAWKRRQIGRKES
jgi:hypothetical protein